MTTDEHDDIECRDGLTMSGVGFLANIKTLTPSIRRRRRCEKHHLELYRDQQNVVPCWDAAIPAPPITPPAAFLMPGGFKRVSSVAAAAAVSKATVASKGINGEQLLTNNIYNIDFNKHYMI